MTIHELEPRFFLGREVGVKQGEKITEFPTEKKVGEVHVFQWSFYGKARGIHTRILTVVDPDLILVSPCQREGYCPYKQDEVRRVIKEGINATPITKGVFRWRP